VLPVAAVVIVLGSLFWISIWMVLRTPTSARAAPSAEVVEVATPVANERDDNSDDFYADGDDGPIISDVRAGALPANEAIDPASEDDDLTNEDVPDDDVMVASSSPDEPAQVASAASSSSASSDRPTGEQVVVVGPLQGPDVPEGFVWASDAPTEQVADANGQSASKAAEVSVKAAEVSVRAAELTAQAAELTARLEGAAAKIEELQARLEASTASMAARPAAVPSPVAVAAAAAPRAAETNARSGQAPASGQVPASGQAQPAASAASASAMAANTAAVAASGVRAPWVMLPQPSPGSRVTAGPLVLETRARGEAPITEIRLQLDGVALSVALERRDDRTWRGRATTRVSPGSHTVAVAVVDGQGRVGSYRWQFDAAGS
jgi:hypothetical protein